MKIKKIIRMRMPTLVPREAPRRAMAKQERKKVTKIRERFFKFIFSTFSSFFTRV